MTSSARPKIVIVGAGFGGLFAARRLAKQAVDVLLIDRHNYHTFTPLIYQVATCALDPSEVAYPVRTIFYKTPNIRFLLAEVTAIDSVGRTLTLSIDGETRQESYDYLLLATGSTPIYFGNEAFRPYTFELRTLNDAVYLRNHILKQFERAAWTSDYSLRDALTTLVVVGGGPTGLETAGAIYELYNHVLQKEYKANHLRARVILVEMTGHLLNPYPDKLRQAARQQAESLGVEVMLNQRVSAVDPESVTLADGTRIPTRTLIWAAGVGGSPLAAKLGVPLQRGGRVPVDETLAVLGLERVYAVGDMVYLTDKTGQPYPQVIPVAMQQGQLAAENILRAIRGETPRPFVYRDKGSMATIGRSRAVAWLYNRLPLRGFVAWVVWLAFHLITLLGFRNRLSVFISWVWNYFTYDRSVRLILERPRAD